MYGCKPDKKKTKQNKRTNLSSMPGYSGTVTGKEELELLTRMKFDNDNVNNFTALLGAIPMYGCKPYGKNLCQALERSP